MDKAVEPARGAPPNDPNDLIAIYTALRRGAGHERVTDANVDALIAMARQYGDAQVEVLLREWRTACGVDPAMPTLPAAIPPAS